MQAFRNGRMQFIVQLQRFCQLRVIQPLSVSPGLHIFAFHVTLHLVVADSDISIMSVSDSNLYPLWSFFPGDSERAHNLPCSPLCDRTTQGVTKSQVSSPCIACMRVCWPRPDQVWEKSNGRVWF